IATGERPNVILIVTDDQGYGDMSCHGNPWLETPNLDRLESQSVSLNDYHVDPYCTPTRASLLTGRWNLRTGAWHVIQGRQLMYESETTVADLFQSSGYTTAMFGKWHLGDQYPYAPQYRGFDHVVCHKAGGVNEIGNPFGNDYFDDTYFRNGKPESLDGYCTNVWFDEVDKFITQEATKDEKPFFVYLATNAMHSPFTVAEKYSEPFMKMGVPKDRSVFYGMIANFDENLGRLLGRLDELELSEDTVVIFMGDNGTAAGATGTKESTDGFNAGMRGWKGSMYEGGHRVACFARWPNQFPAGKKIESLTAHVDWLPTLAKICGLSIPENLTIDGRNILSLLTGGQDNWPDERTLLFERQKHKLTEFNAAEDKGQIAVLTEKWRLVHGELYDIAEDPGQKNNLASKHPDVVKELASRHQSWFRDVTSHNGHYAPFIVGGDEHRSTTLTVRDWMPTEGHVIWRQEQLGDEKRNINGFWAIKPAMPGKYQIRLSRFPSDHVQPMSATEARIKVGPKTFTKSCLASDSSVNFEVELEAKSTTLQTWLTNKKAGTQRGAYFVEIQ
ncbi:MAG: arylsulfatase, partial [Planctomycetota bacterium]